MNEESKHAPCLQHVSRCLRIINGRGDAETSGRARLHRSCFLLPAWLCILSAWDSTSVTSGRIQGKKTQQRHLGRGKTPAGVCQVQLKCTTFAHNVPSVQNSMNWNKLPNNRPGLPFWPLNGKTWILDKPTCEHFSLRHYVLCVCEILFDEMMRYFCRI